MKCSNDVYELFFCVVSNIFSTRMHSSADKIFENVYVMFSFSWTIQTHVCAAYQDSESK